MRKRFKFLVDVDDVLRNLVHNMVRLYNKEFGTNMAYDDVKIYFTNQSFPKAVEKYGDAPQWFFQEHGYELFYGSEPIEGAIEAVNKLKEYGTVHIVTKQRSVQNKIDTLMWLDKWAVKYDSVSFVTHKSIVDCDVFIDDFHENFIDCGKMGATGVLLNAPYNKDIDTENLRKYSNFSKIVRIDSLSQFVDNIEQFL